MNEAKKFDRYQRRHDAQQADVKARALVSLTRRGRRTAASNHVARAIQASRRVLLAMALPLDTINTLADVYASDVMPKETFSSGDWCEYQLRRMRPETAARVMAKHNAAVIDYTERCRRRYARAD